MDEESHQQIADASKFAPKQQTFQESQDKWIPSIHDDSTFRWRSLQLQIVDLLRRDETLLESSDLAMTADRLFMLVKGWYYQRDADSRMLIAPSEPKEKEFELIDTPVKLMNMLFRSPDVIMFEFLIAKNMIDPEEEGYWLKIRAIDGHASPQQRGSQGFRHPDRVELTERDTPCLLYTSPSPRDRG